MKKRAAVLFLAAVMAVTLSPAAQAAPNQGSPFLDLPEVHWSYEYVFPLYQQGVINGYPDGTFQPKGEVTWGEAFKLILLATGVDEPEPEEGRHWAYPYIEPALDEKLVYSFDEGALNEVPTRLAVARMTARALDLTDISGESPYDDCTDGYVTELFEKGIMDGFLNEDGSRSFQPDKTISREEMAAIIYRVKNIDVTQGMFRFNNYWLDRFDTVAATPFSPEQFVKDEETGRISYTGGYYTHGVDVSGHKLDIDWEAVAADGIDFAIVRAGNRTYGSGLLFEDSYFHKNMQGAIDAGLDVGAYFFSNAITVEEAEEEAEMFLAMVEPYREHVTYPVVCDWEYLGGKDSRAYGVDAEVITDCVNAFCKKVAEAGYIPMFYFNEYCGYVKMDLSRLIEYPFWYAEYKDAPGCIYNFQMWQYSSKGQVAGIDSAVDLDLCFVPYPGGAVSYPNLAPGFIPPVDAQPDYSTQPADSAWPDNSAGPAFPDFSTPAYPEATPEPTPALPPEETPELTPPPILVYV